MASVDVVPVHLTDGRTSVVVDTTTGAPTLVYWGAALGDLGPDELVVSLGALSRPPVPGGLDIVAPASVVPEPGSGYPGRPGLAGRRANGTGWSPRFATTAAELTGNKLAVSGRTTGLRSSC